MDRGVATGLVDLLVGDGSIVDAEDDVVSESAYGRWKLALQILELAEIAGIN